MTTLHLALKGEYFDAIKAGTKPEEYRLVTPYWRKRLEGRSYSQITLTKGYPAADDHARRLTLPWRGFTVKTIQHAFFGPAPVEVFAIDVSGVAPTRAPLTDDEIDKLQEQCDCFGCDSCDIRIHEFARAVEAHICGVRVDAPTDTERLAWLTRSISGKALRDAGVTWPVWSLENAREAIDRARNAGVRVDASIKEHVVRETVNAATKVAREFHATQQLRCRMVDALTPLIKAARGVKEDGRG